MTLSGLSPLGAVPIEIATDALIGRTIAGKYRVLSRVGSGGMGAVYKAQQIALEKPVAVKVLHAALEVDKQFVQRFHVEAKAASMFDHPSSTRVMDFGEEPDGLLYIVMEFLEGLTLLDVLHRDFPLAPSRVADILRQTLAALAVAHERGILHRDLKPENIVILQGRDDEGHSHDVVKVCDFGIAKLAVENGPVSSVVEGAITLRDGTPGPSGTVAQRISTEPSRPVRAISTTPSGVQITPAPARAVIGPPITRVGLIIGTPEYMSPEQAQGEAVDSRSDLYSLGCVLYHLITGQPPFHGDTPLVTATLHSTIEAKKPSVLRPDVDPTLERVCLRAMQKNPDDRYATARDMRSDLRSLVNQPGTEPQFLPSSAESSAKLQPIGADAISAISVPALRGIGALGTVTGAAPRKTGYVFGAALLAIGLASALWIFVRPSATPQTGSGIEAANGVDAAAATATVVPTTSPVAVATSAVLPIAPPPPTNVPSAVQPTAHPTGTVASDAAMFPKARASVQSVDEATMVSKGAVIRALQTRVSTMKGCYLEALKKSGGVTVGSVHLTMDVVAGRVANAVVDDDLGQPSLKTCVEHSVVRAAVDGAEPGAKASATVTFSNDS